MDIPIELFSLFIGTSIALAIFGFLRNPQIPAMLVFGGMFILTMSVMTDNIILNQFIDGDSSITYYDVQTRSFEQAIFSGSNAIQAEELQTSQSLLTGDRINCLTTWLRITGSPPVGTLIQYGIWDVNGNLKYQIGTMNRTMLTTSATPYKLCNFSNDYTLIATDRIGVKYQAGNSTNSVILQLDANNPFDSTITRQSRFDSGTLTWTSFTANDYMGIISLESQSGEQFVNGIFEFTEFPKTIFALLAVIFMLTGGLMVFTRER